MLLVLVFKTKLCECCVGFHCFAECVCSFSTDFVACFIPSCQNCVHPWNCQAPTCATGPALWALCWLSKPRSMHALLHGPSCCLFCSLLLNKSCLYLNRVVFAPLRVSATSVVLTFKASLSAHVPVSLNLFAVYRFLVSRLDSVLSCCCYAPSRSSVLNVALTFNASLSAIAPFVPISLSSLCIHV